MAPEERTTRTMRLANAIVTMATVAIAAGGIVAAPDASADGYPITQQFGSEESVSTGGQNQGVVGWTVNNLRIMVHRLRNKVRSFYAGSQRRVGLVLTPAM